MQEAYQPIDQPVARPRRRGIAFTSGLLFAGMSAILLFGADFLTGFDIMSFKNPLIPFYSASLLLAFLGSPGLAGVMAGWRSGHTSGGTFAGLWNGLLVGIIEAINLDLQVIMPVLNKVDQFQQQGVDTTAINKNHLILSALPEALLLGLIIILIFLGIGALLGFIGGLIGATLSREKRAL